MADEVEALWRCKQPQRDRDELNDLVEAARARGAQEGFQLRKRQFDRIEVRTIRRQKAEPGPRALDRRLDLDLLMHCEVVEDDHIAGTERGHEHLLDVGEKRGIVDRPVKYCRRREPVTAQRGDDRMRLPMAVRRVIAEADPARAAAVAAQEIRGDARFVDKDVAARIVQGQGILPAAARGGDISAPLFVRVYRFF